MLFINSMAKLKKESILLKDGMTSTDGRTVHLSDFVLDPHIAGYSIRNGRIAYITPHKKLYFLPYSQLVENTLLHNGYKRKIFFFPFCDGDYPVFE